MFYYLPLFRNLKPDPRKKYFLATKLLKKYPDITFNNTPKKCAFF